MTNEFTNRLDSFRTTLTFLDQPANRVLWFNQSPARFTTRVAEAQDAVAAHALGLAVAECSRTLGNETDAAKAEFSLSTWRRMRDATLLATSRQIILLAQGLLTGQPAAAAECGITSATIASTTKEADDFEAIINAPQGAIAGRKALTALMRDRFNAVEAIFTSLDNLVVQFPSAVFVQGFNAARITRDLGRGPSEPITTLMPTPPTV